MNARPPNPSLETLLLAVHLCNNSQAELARRINRSKQDIWNWLNRDKRAPVDACPFIEAACGDPRVTCELLRPDYEGWALLRASALDDRNFNCA
ncbi:transcriptional regulator [Paraburkholderia sp. GAS33]|uniref:transcriptional regulator n=1 Tax=Paraburkholderia sp. GAS33 TaxID=3035130 RepID=UPI003D1CEC02